MSTFKRVTKHPQTRVYEIATWIDDYFGDHIYGVAFQSDGKVYPTELVDDSEIKNFWAADVKTAFLRFLEEVGMVQTPEEHLLQYLNLIQRAYDARWERDPAKGEGASLEDAEFPED